MKLVVDANILFSALIKNSITAELLLQPDLKLYCPDFIIIEILKHEGIVLNKTSRKKQDLYKILARFYEITTIVSNEEYKEYLSTAESVSQDPADVPYLALAMKLNCALWSNDKKLKNQDKISIFSTKELLDKLIQNRKL